jgi:hypothetical protein
MSSLEGRRGRRKTSKAGEQERRTVWLVGIRRTVRLRRKWQISLSRRVPGYFIDLMSRACVLASLLQNVLHG